MIIDLEIGDARWVTALSVLRELRPELSDDVFARVLREGAAQGLRFTGLFRGDDCVAIAGWRVLVTMGAGRKMYIDDLATAATERSQGHGTALFAALTSRARGAGCRTIELDSGVQRHAAHRLLAGANGHHRTPLRASPRMSSALAWIDAHAHRRGEAIRGCHEWPGSLRGPDRV